MEAVWKRAREAGNLERVIIATDDDRILETCRAFGAEAELTSPDHPSGSDRVAEVAVRFGRGFDVIVNIQGDEPFVTGSSLDRLVQAIADDETAQIATLAEPILDPDELFDTNAVKVVSAADGRALYFSRCPIPYHRGPTGSHDMRSALESRPDGLDGYRKHQGIYAYRKEILLALTRLPCSPLERDEGLEQLRALQAGLRIRVLDSDFRSIGVDTPEDLERALSYLAESEA